MKNSDIGKKEDIQTMQIHLKKKDILNTLNSPIELYTLDSRLRGNDFINYNKSIFFEYLLNNIELRDTVILEIAIAAPAITGGSSQPVK